MHCMCLYEIPELDSCVVSPSWGGTRNSEFVCFHVLFQTIGQMVIIGPTTLKLMNVE